MVRMRLKVLMAEKELREGRKITFRTLTEETGLSMATINRLVNGKAQQVAFATLAALCKYFQCEVGALLEYVEPQEAKS